MATTERDLRGQIEALEAAWAAPSADQPTPSRPEPEAARARTAGDGEQVVASSAGSSPNCSGRFRRGWAEPISPSWSLAGGLAWVGLTAVALALEPAPAAAGSTAALPALAAALGFVYGVLLCATFAGLASGRRLGFSAGVLAAGFALLLTAACPLTGHHDWALWQLGRLGTDSALLAISLAGLRRA